MNKKQKKMLFRIILSFLLTLISAFIPLDGILKLIIFIIPYLIISYDVLLKAAKRIKNGRMLDECFLMAIATIGAFVLGYINGGDYIEAVAVMLFYQIGELFQSYAVGKSRKSIMELMDIRPDYANVEIDGKLTRVDPQSLKIGSIITVNPGEKIPIDGMVISGNSSINTSMLTGESVPVDVKENDNVYSGSLNINGVLKIKTTKEFSESTASKILDLVENASAKKSKSENFISKFAKIYTPAVCLSALILAIFPPLVSYLSGNDANVTVYLYRALSFLVASCPCALVISIPLSFFAGMGCGSKNGILIKGSSYIEALSKTGCVVFDKTGTLTKGNFEISDIKTQNISKDELLEYAAYCENASSHPISRSIIKYYGKDIDINRISNVSEISGEGIIATIDEKCVACGNKKLMTRLNIDVSDKIFENNIGTSIYVAIDNVYEGNIFLCDNIKETSYAAIQSLKKENIKCIMLSGDKMSVAKNVSEALSLDGYKGELLPGDKVAEFESIMKKSSKNTAFVGDGINDAPVLSRADVGIAMGGVGSDAAIEAADVVIMDDDVRKISLALKISKKCIRIVYENIFFAIGIKLLALILVALGFANMWLSIFADVGVMVLAVVNAIRAMFVKKT